MLLICVSTVFLNQHSVIDVFCGVLLTTVLFYMAYYTNWMSIPGQITKKISKARPEISGDRVSDIKN